MADLTSKMWLVRVGRPARDPWGWRWREGSGVHLYFEPGPPPTRADVLAAYRARVADLSVPELAGFEAAAAHPEFPQFSERGGSCQSWPNGVEVWVEPVTLVGGLVAAAGQWVWQVTVQWDADGPGARAEVDFLFDCPLPTLEQVREEAARGFHVAAQKAAHGQLNGVVSRNQVCVSAREGGKGGAA